MTTEVTWQVLAHAFLPTLSDDRGLQLLSAADAMRGIASVILRRPVEPAQLQNHSDVVPTLILTLILLQAVPTK